MSNASQFVEVSSAYGLYLNRQDFTRCGLLSYGGGVTSDHNKARAFASIDEANEFARSNGWKISCSVPDYGTTAYACQLYLRTATWQSYPGIVNAGYAE